MGVVIKKKDMKRLLVNVLGRDDIEKYSETSTNKIWYQLKGDTLDSYYNVHKFVTKCKKWAAEKGHYISTSYERDGVSAHSNKITATALNTYKDEYTAIVMLCIEINKKDNR